MEIYYCQLCGTKIDSDELEHGDAVRRGADQVYCRACASKAPPPRSAPATATPAGPVRPVTRDHRPIRTPLRPHDKPLPKAHAPAPVSPKSFAMIVLGLGAAILITGLAVVFKSKPEAEKPPEKTPDKVVDPTAPKPVELKPAPTIEKPTAADLEKSADDAFSSIQKNLASRSPKENIDALNNFLEHYPSSSSVPRVRVELSRLLSTQKALNEGFVTLSTFENDDETWTFYDGTEFKGAKGASSRDASDKKEGSKSIKLMGDFTGGGAYVSIDHTFSGAAADAMAGIPYARVAGFRVWVRSPVAGAISIRAGDSGGQCHQQTLSFTPKDEWQQVELKNFSKGQRYSHWGGKNDGVFYWPLRNLAFMLTSEGVGSTKKAEVNLDQVELILTPEK